MLSAALSKSPSEITEWKAMDFLYWAAYLNEKTELENKELEKKFKNNNV